MGIRQLYYDRGEIKDVNSCPGWCSSVDWVLACKPRGHGFNSQPGHMPRLQARSPVGGTREATIHWCFSPSFSPSFPLSLKINKIYFSKQLSIQSVPFLQRLFQMGVLEITWHCEISFERLTSVLWPGYLPDFLVSSSFWPFRVMVHSNTLKEIKLY